MKLLFLSRFFIDIAVLLCVYLHADGNKIYTTV